MMTATSATAGAGKSHGAWRWVKLDRTREPAALRPGQEILKLLLRLREHLRGRRSFDTLLDGHADDVAILGHADDLRQSLAADLQRGLIRLVPVRRHLRLRLHVGAVPRRGTTDTDAGHELAHHVRL